MLEASKDAAMETDKDKIDVSDDNIFLQLLIEKHNISPKQLASWTGRATSTVYKYLSGEIAIPSVIFRCLFERTLDITILNIIIGTIPCIVAPLTCATIPPDAATLTKLIDDRLKQIKCEQYALQILKDGKVDQSDAAAIAHYKDAFSEMVSTEAQIYQAILHEYSKVKIKQ